MRFSRRRSFRPASIVQALRSVYRAVDAEAGQAALDAFAQSPWGEMYPAIAQSWRRKWDLAPRRPSSTIRILSSAEKCRRVARRMSLTTCSAGLFAFAILVRIFVVPSDIDETKTLLKSQPQIWAMGAEGAQFYRTPTKFGSAARAG